jgi:hypothetical protein
MKDIVEEKYVGTLPFILGAGVLLVVSLLLAFAVYAEKSGRPAGGPLYDSAFMMVFERADCAKCDEFRATVAKKYLAGPFAGKVGMKYFDVTDGQPPKRYKLKSHVAGSPTIVVFDVYGREEKRYDGVPTSVETLETFAYYADKRAAYEVQRGRN